MLIALRQVARNKLRASLTVIGITIGIAAVVTMIALGKGARSSVSATVSSLGSNALMVFPNSSRTSGARNNQLGTRLSELDCEALSRQGSSIRLAAPFMRASAQAIYEGQNTKTSVIGSRLSYFDVRNLKVTKGEPGPRRASRPTRRWSCSARPPAKTSSAPSTPSAARSGSAATPTG